MTEAIPAASFTVRKDLSVAQLVLAYLEIEQATVLFGIPGAAVMHLLDELKRQRASFRYLIARQETGAAYMADGYARVSGKPGVVLVTSGPGATNALTGSMNAQAAGVALLTLTGEVPEAFFGKGYLQEGADAGLNVEAIYGNAEGYSRIVTTAGNAQTLLEQALRNALGRPASAAHLSLPDDVAAARLDRVSLPTAPANYRSLAQGCDRAGVERAFKQLCEAERPLILLGSGAAQALRGPRLAVFTAWVERHAFAVMTTPDAKAVFPESHPLSLRCFGVAFCEWTQYYLAPRLLDPTLPEGYDALLVLGTQLGGFSSNKWDPILVPQGSLMQVDLRPEVIGRAWPITFGVVGEIGAVIDELAALSRTHRDHRADKADAADEATTASRRDFIARIKQQKSPYLAPEQRDSTATPIAPAAVMKCLNQNLPAGSEIFIDAGNCVGWALHYLAVDPPTRVHSALAMGPMGFAVAAVVGAKLAAPERVCVAICGDGAFLMHGNEVSTAATYGLSALWIVLDNQDLAMVSQGMNQFFPDPQGWRDYYSLGQADLAAMAQALGADAYRAASLVDLQHALGAALNTARTSRKPQVIVVRIDKTHLPPYYPDPGTRPGPAAVLPVPGSLIGR